MRFTVIKASNVTFSIEADNAEVAVEAVKTGEGEAIGFTENYAVRPSQPERPVASGKPRQRNPVKIK